jgi:ketosteroid isomerase-like protein
LFFTGAGDNNDEPGIMATEDRTAKRDAIHNNSFAGHARGLYFQCLNMEKMKNFILASCLLFCAGSYAQSTKEIDQQVWLPFIKTFNSYDDDGFSAVHSKDVIRVSQDSKQIYGYDQYFPKKTDAARARQNTWTRDIQLRFLQRIDGTDKAFEVGYYKTTSTNTATGEKRTGYGKFHVLLRKENGVWKILMDADAHEKTDETVFLTAEPIKQ